MLRERQVSSASTPRTRVAISFGSPAGDSGVTRLDLNDILISHPQAAFLMRVAGSAMRDAGIDDGDMALVVRAIDASHGQVVIAVLRDEFVCRRLCRRADDLGLEATDPEVPTHWAKEGDSFEIWGVVTHLVKQVSATP